MSGICRFVATSIPPSFSLSVHPYIIPKSCNLSALQPINMSAYTFRQSKQLRKLRKAIMNRPPYCSGTVPVQAIELSLFYGEGEQARSVSHYITVTSRS